MHTLFTRKVNPNKSKGEKVLSLGVVLAGDGRAQDIQPTQNWTSAKVLWSPSSRAQDGGAWASGWITPRHCGYQSAALLHLHAGCGH